MLTTPKSVSHSDLSPKLLNISTQMHNMHLKLNKFKSKPLTFHPRPITPILVNGNSILPVAEVPNLDSSLSPTDLQIPNLEPSPSWHHHSSQYGPSCSSPLLRCYSSVLTRLLASALALSVIYFQRYVQGLLRSYVMSPLLLQVFPGPGLPTPFSSHSAHNSKLAPFIKQHAPTMGPCAYRTSCLEGASPDVCMALFLASSWLCSNVIIS